MSKPRLPLPLLLDGATGTQFMKFGMPAGVCVEQWASEHPDIIRQVAVSYADAGSDIVYAPTFLANAASLRPYGLSEQVTALNTGIVRTMREALAGREVLVAGDMSTTGLLCEPFGETEFIQLTGIYAEQAHALADAGADLVVIETMSSLTECRAAVMAARQTGLPVLLSMTVDAAGRTMWGDDILAAMLVLQDLGLSAFGLNCSHGPDGMIPLIARLAPFAKLPLIAKPNAGEPPLTPVQFSDRCAALMRAGVRVVGGCCGTDPQYIRALRHMMDSFDIEKVSVPPAEYDLLTAARNVYYLRNDFGYSKPILCQLDMADSLLEAAHESCDAALIRLEAPDDGYLFSLNAHMLDMPVAFESESLEALENALLHYHGKALLVSTSCEIESDELEQLAARYGAIVM